MNCERCGRMTSGYHLHDYCAECGINLCPECMEKGCCGHMPAKSGMKVESADSDGVNADTIDGETIKGDLVSTQEIVSESEIVSQTVDCTKVEVIP